jgi:hypothetical protein
LWFSGSLLLGLFVTGIAHAQAEGDEGEPAAEITARDKATESSASDLPSSAESAKDKAEPEQLTSISPVHEAHAANVSASPAAPVAVPTGHEPGVTKPAESKGLGVESKQVSAFEITGYVQSQVEFHQDSENQLRQGGALLNQDRFSVRRGRVRIARDWDYASFLIEFDGNTTKGPSARLQKGEASLVYGRSKSKGVPPLAQLTFGLFDLPFGFEMTDSAKTRWFMERSIMSRAIFPGEPDVGMRFNGAAGFLRYSLAATNGEPLDEKSGFGLQDPNANKDITVRIGADTKPSSALGLAGGISYNRGRGFHPGADATKATLTGTDSNGDGVPESFAMNPGKAAIPSKTFERWAMSADLQLRLRTVLGQSMLYGEVVVAQNLDRGLMVADPTVANINVREFGGYIGFIQEVTKYGVIGVRGDYYDPNADFLDTRAGKQVPTDLRILGISPLVGLVLPERARLLFQWDIQDNKLARDTRGVPSHLKNNAAIIRLQVNL